MPNCPCDHQHKDAGSQHSLQHAAILNQYQRLLAVQSLCQIRCSSHQLLVQLAATMCPSFKGRTKPCCICKSAGAVGNLAELFRLCRPAKRPQPPLCSSTSVIVDVSSNLLAKLPPLSGQDCCSMLMCWAASGVPLGLNEKRLHVTSLCAVEAPGPPAAFGTCQSTFSRL